MDSMRDNFGGLSHIEEESQHDLMSRTSCGDITGKSSMRGEFGIMNTLHIIQKKSSERLMQGVDEEK